MDKEQSILGRRKVLGDWSDSDSAVGAGFGSSTDRGFQSLLAQLGYERQSRRTNSDVLLMAVAKKGREYGIPADDLRKWSGLAFDAVATDLDAKKLTGETDLIPGWLFIFRSADGVVISWKYLARELSQEATQFFQPHGVESDTTRVRCEDIVAIDVWNLQQRVFDRLFNRFENLPVMERYSAKEISDALQDRRWLMREIESAHRGLKK